MNSLLRLFVLRLLTAPNSLIPSWLIDLADRSLWFKVVVKADVTAVYDNRMKNKKSLDDCMMDAVLPHGDTYDKPQHW